MLKEISREPDGFKVRVQSLTRPLVKLEDSPAAREAHTVLKTEQNSEIYLGV
jgi:hypothetical protein